jgi:hypothetical protein
VAGLNSVAADPGVELALLSWLVPDVGRIAISLPVADVGIDESAAAIAATLAT